MFYQIEEMFYQMAEMTTKMTKSYGYDGSYI